MLECRYPSDVTDGQWQLIEQLLPKLKVCGRPRIDRRAVLNATLYVVRTGCQWRQLPGDFPKWSSVYTVFWRWRRDGVWQRVHDALRDRVRAAAGKKASPSVAIVDSQAIRTAEGGEERGHDAGKKITGRKRHLAVDTLGLVLAVVHGANWQDYDGAVFVFFALQERFRRLKAVFADAAYGRNGLPAWVKETFGWVLQTVLRPAKAKGFVVLHKRWVDEGTFGWLMRYRRHSRDDERNPESSEAMVYIAMINVMSRRLAAGQRV